MRLRQANSARCAGSCSSPTHSVMSHHVSGRPCLLAPGSQTRTDQHDQVSSCMSLASNLNMTSQTGTVSCSHRRHARRLQLWLPLRRCTTNGGEHHHGADDYLCSRASSLCVFGGSCTHSGCAVRATVRWSASPWLLDGLPVLAQGAQVAQIRRQRRQRRRPRLVLTQQAPDAHVQRCGVAGKTASVEAISCADHPMISIQQTHAGFLTKPYQPKCTEN